MKESSKTWIWFAKCFANEGSTHNLANGVILNRVNYNVLIGELQKAKLCGFGIEIYLSQLVIGHFTSGFCWKAIQVWKDGKRSLVEQEFGEKYKMNRLLFRYVHSQL